MERESDLDARGSRASAAACRRPPPGRRPWRDGGARRLHRRGASRCRARSRGDRCRRADLRRQACARLRRPQRRGRRRGDCAAARGAPAGRLRPREGRARPRPRARRRRARGRDRMTRVLVAGIVAGLISILAAPRFIDFLRRKELGQQIREEGPERHVVKKGTPTAGGILILLAASIAFLALSKFKITGLTVLFVTLGCGAIGFLDDFIKFTHKRSLGLSGRWKLLLLACVAAGTGYLAHRAGLPNLTSVLIPGTGYRLPLGPFWYVFIFLVIAGASNGVNLTDGLDGLAAGTAIISLFTLTTMAVIAFIRSDDVPRLRDAS